MRILTEIKFGTDGWRAVIADEFTFSNVRAVTLAIARFLEEEKKEQDGIVIGFDNRFLSEQFAAQAAATLMTLGIKVLLCLRPAPTPAVAFAVRRWKSAGALMFTASHNPPQYHGLKFIPHYAGPALPRETDRITELVKLTLLQGFPDKGSPEENVFKDLLEVLTRQLRVEFSADGKDIFQPEEEKGLLKIIEPSGPYLKHLERLVDTETIAAAAPSVVIDSMFGSSIGYLEAFLLPLGCQLEVIRDHRDPFFGGILPDPSEQNLEKLRRVVLNVDADVGIALDGDGDRLGIISAAGGYLNANQILVLLLEHLVQSRHWKGKVARTVATTHNLDRLAEHYSLSVIETPVGFKYIGQALREDAFLGGEESGGVSVRGHLPEKDGILASLLFIEMLAASGGSPDEIFQKVAAKIDLLSSTRMDIHASASKKAEILARLKTWEPQELAGIKVEKINRLDGLKLLLKDGSWCLVRASGTEDLFRIYAESPEKSFLNKLIEEVCRKLELQDTVAI